jgi:hypothetical protein
MTGLGLELLSLEKAVTLESKRIASDVLNLSCVPTFTPTALLRFGYIARSSYGKQLERWLRYFPPESIHLSSFEGYVADPRSEWLRMLEFLNLDRWVPNRFRDSSSHAGRLRQTDVPTATRLLVREYLVDDMHQFYRLAGKDFGWR